MSTTKHLVRVTQEPGVVREVDSAELLDLARSGILYSYEHTEEAKDVLGGAHVKVPGKWSGPSKSDEVVTSPPAMTDPAGSELTAVGTEKKEG